ncbi:universal stress protein [Roseobacter weihaiensis]|uniref:universal stress protein n=1 Tax=Roseobacter weihaiensis TaxID=2763262 RepID=UPI001D0B78AB|nr:universal stress protein [Roseobacter sp. H9]
MAVGSKIPRPRTATASTHREDPERADRSNVLVFIGPDQKNVAALWHAQMVAQAFGGHVVLLRVMTPPADNSSLIDPVEWDIKKRTALKCPARLAEPLDRKEEKAEPHLFEGRLFDQISACVEARKGDIAAALRSRDQGCWQFDDTILGVLNSQSAAILMIPDSSEWSARQGIRRILVPIDGSTRSERALGQAVTLAKAENAALLLFYVAPEPGLTEFGVIDSRAVELNEAVIKRNTRAGRAHLNRITNRLAHHNLQISTRIVPSGDARRVLLAMGEKEGVDLVVMATHGQGEHSDVPVGDVAHFILDRAEVPVLMVRHDRDGRSAKRG